MTRRPLLVALLLTACSNDFGIKGLDPEPQAGAEDTGEAEEAEDTGAGEEPAPEEEEEPEAEDPEEEDPAPEEEEEEEEPEEDPAPADDCTETDDRIYVIERDDDAIYIFDPETLRFERQGVLDCEEAYWSSPESMAVGRDGLAWLRTSDDALYAVSLESLDCTPTDFRLPRDFDSFGMGFATERDGTWRDHLFIADGDHLGRLDTFDLTVETLGRMPSQSELTGNSAGELWAFLPLESPATLARLDHEDASTVEAVPLPGFPRATDIDTFAFATWGGEFWLFVRTYGMGSSTDVYRVDAAGDLTLELEDVGFDVVGAGVSTCAPSE